jgi:hypothetical protein
MILIIEWINNYGAYGLWLATLIGILVVALIFLIFSWLRYEWIVADITRGGSKNNENRH